MFGTSVISPIFITISKNIDISPRNSTSYCSQKSCSSTISDDSISPRSTKKSWLQKAPFWRKKNRTSNARDNDVTSPTHTSDSTESLSSVMLASTSSDTATSQHLRSIVGPSSSEVGSSKHLERPASDGRSLRTKMVDETSARALRYIVERFDNSQKTLTLLENHTHGKNSLDADRKLSGSIKLIAETMAEHEGERYLLERIAKQLDPQIKCQEIIPQDLSHSDLPLRRSHSSPEPSSSISYPETSEKPMEVEHLPQVKPSFEKIHTFFQKSLGHGSYIPSLVSDEDLEKLSLVSHDLQPSELQRLKDQAQMTKQGLTRQRTIATLPSHLIYGMEEHYAATIVHLSNLVQYPQDLKVLLNMAHEITDETIKGRVISQLGEAVAKNRAQAMKSPEALQQSTEMIHNILKSINGLDNQQVIKQSFEAAIKQACENQPSSHQLTMPAFSPPTVQDGALNISSNLSTHIIGSGSNSLTALYNPTAFRQPVLTEQETATRLSAHFSNVSSERQAEILETTQALHTHRESPGIPGELAQAEQLHVDKLSALLQHAQTADARKLILDLTHQITDQNLKRTLFRVIGENALRHSDMTTFSNVLKSCTTLSDGADRLDILTAFKDAISRLGLKTQLAVLHEIK